MKTQMMIIIILLVITGRMSAQGVFVSGNVRVESNAILSVMGNIDIDNGTLTIDPEGKLLMGNLKSLTVDDGGTIRVIGDDVNKAIISSPGFFHFNILNGGTIAAENALIERTEGNGLQIHEGAQIDTEHPLQKCIFQDGSPESTLLTINNNQVLTINGVEFNHTPGVELYNVMKNNDEGKITFTNFTGNFGGEENELDPNSRIYWIAFIQFDLDLQNISIGSGKDTCINALQMISVAGGGTTFIVESEAQAELIAGEKILLLYGTLIKKGSQFHAWITEDASFCQNEKSLVTVAQEASSDTPKVNLPIPKEASFRVYPNPVSTLLTIENLKPENKVNGEIEIYDFIGKQLESKTLTANTYQQIDFTGFPMGIYMIRLKKGSETVLLKIIKQ